MRTLLDLFRPFRHIGTGLCCLLVLISLANPTARAAGPTPVRSVCAPTQAVAQAPGHLFADSDGWSWRKLFSGLGSRTRVVQICIVAMCLALFILMKK
jgi:hypothetical protein